MNVTIKELNKAWAMVDYELHLWHDTLNVLIGFLSGVVMCILLNNCL
jgi:hypothetical protein